MQDSIIYARGFIKAIKLINNQKAFTNFKYNCMLHSVQLIDEIFQSKQMFIKKAPKAFILISNFI